MSAAGFTRADFDHGWRRRFGGANPERMHDRFWSVMIESGESAWAARGRVGTIHSHANAPTWCFERFGQTRTRLADGRVICVGGEHEDSYDPDFLIYNDVVVFDTDGGHAIFGYPEDVFPPTDGHTATLVGDDLWLIGNVGYSGVRGGRAQVFRLNLRTLRTTRVETRGDDPGWIGRCRAALMPGGNAIRIGDGERSGRNVRPADAAELDLATRRWSRIEHDELPWASGPDCGPFDPISVKDRYSLHDALRREIPPGHPMFGVELWPVCQDIYTTVLEVADGSGRYAVAEVDFVAGRASLPDPEIRVFDRLEDAMTAALP